jgi:hypothetical protein
MHLFFEYKAGPNGTYFFKTEYWYLPIYSLGERVFFYSAFFRDAENMKMTDGRNDIYLLIKAVQPLF